MSASREEAYMCNATKGQFDPECRGTEMVQVVR
jgi:hypothetical protein